jgi:DNA-binding CsgD family transcriptional regulator
MRYIEGNAQTARIVILSVRQLQVLVLLVEGKSNGEIADILRLDRKGDCKVDRKGDCKVNTVKTHVGTLLHSLGMENRTALATWVGQHPGILKDGRAAVGDHPAECACGFSYCPGGKRVA